MRVAPPTSRPISGRRENLRFPATLLGKSGNRDFGIPSGCHWGGVSWIPAFRFLTSPPRVLYKASGENGVRKLTTCADRRGPAFESRPTCRPISRRSGNLRFPARLLGKSGNRIFWIPPGRHLGDVYWIPKVGVLTSPPRAFHGGSPAKTGSEN